MNRHRRKCRWQRMEWSNFRRHHLGTSGEASYDAWMKRTRRWEEAHTIDNRRPPAISSICIWSYQGYKNSNKLIIIERLWYLVYTFGQTKDARIRRCKENHTNGCEDSALRGRTHYSRSGDRWWSKLRHMNEEVPAECKHNAPSPLHIWGKVVSLRHLSEEVPAECKHDAARL